MRNPRDLRDTHKVSLNKFILISFSIVFIAMASGLLFQNLKAELYTSIRAAPQGIQAGDLSVVGQPSLPAATVDAIFKSLGSPMTGTGQVVVQASRQSNIDDAFALAVWWTETNDGAAGVGLADHNPGSVRGSVGYPSAFDGYTIYPSYSAAIVYWFNMLRNTYVNNRGLSTVYAISYPYVGTSSSPLWAGKVVALMLKYRGEAPPPSIVVQHGKKVADPRAKAQTGGISLARQGQIGEASKQTANMTRHLKAPAVLPLSIEYTVVVFALLLALAIATWALKLHNRAPTQIMDAPNTDSLRTFGQDTATPDTYAVGASALAMNIPNTESLPHILVISASQTIDATPSAGGFTPDTGPNFPIRRINLLSSKSTPERSVPAESLTAIKPGGRSTGLLSRYSEMCQG
jgi:hypothetical protein